MTARCCYRSTPRSRFVRTRSPRLSPRFAPFPPPSFLRWRSEGIIVAWVHSMRIGRNRGIVWSSQVGEAALERGQHRLRPIGRSQLLQHVVDVILDCALAHRERRGDLLVALALRQLL